MPSIEDLIGQAERGGARGQSWETALPSRALARLASLTTSEDRLAGRGSASRYGESSFQAMKYLIMNIR